MLMGCCVDRSYSVHTRRPEVLAKLLSNSRPPADALRARLGVVTLEARDVPASIAPPIDLSNVHVVDVAGGAKQLVANVAVAGQNVGTALIDATTKSVPGATCPVLDLHLSPIHLSLLGLNVDTSNICLDVSAVDH